MGLENYFADNAWVLFLLTLWVIPWKGYALWTAAKRNEKWWFIAILVINTLAILEIVYLFGFAKVQEDWKGAEKKPETPKIPDAPKAPETPEHS